MIYINRQMESAVLSASEHYPVVMVCGQRQTGKSTMLRHLSDEGRRYVTFDDAKTKNLAKEDPALFFETYGTKLIIDEFQRVPDILLEIKRIVDDTAYRGENANGMFWLTGSQKFVMMKNISESLAGRVAVFNMLPLSQREIDNRPFSLFDPDIAALKQRAIDHYTTLDIFTRIFEGGLPKIVSDKGIDRELYYSSYMNTYIEKDISSLEQIGKLDEFRSFVTCMAANTARELNLNSISKVVGVSAPTIKAWITILERSGMIFILRPYSSNITKRLVKQPKCYFLDTGLAAYLTSWPSAETLMNGNASGAFFETYVVSEILKSFYNNGKEPLLYYYRDFDQKEIDLILIRGDKVFPIEIKKAKSPSNPTKNFNVMNRFNMQVMPGLVICMTDELFPVTRDSWLCPVSLI